MEAVFAKSSLDIKALEQYYPRMRFERKIARLQKKRVEAHEFYTEEIEKAGKRQNQEEANHLRAEAASILNDLDRTISNLITGKLLEEAESLLVPLPPYDDSKHWCEDIDSPLSRKQLTPVGIAFVRDAIREEQKKRSEDRAVNMEKVVKWATVLTGLFGAIIGILAAIERLLNSGSK